MVYDLVAAANCVYISLTPFAPLGAVGVCHVLLHTL